MLKRTMFEKWLKREYDLQWPKTLLDMVENEEFSIEDACRMIAYCVTKGKEFPEDYKGWEYLADEMRYYGIIY